MRDGCATVKWLQLFFLLASKIPSQNVPDARHIIYNSLNINNMSHFNIFCSKTCYNRDYYKRHKQKIYHRQAQRNIAPKETRVQPSIQLR